MDTENGMETRPAEEMAGTEEAAVTDAAAEDTEKMEAAVPQDQAAPEENVTPQEKDAPEEAHSGGPDEARDAALMAHARRVVQQARALERLVPGITRELEDPQFRYLTGPEVGLDLRTAHELLHRADTQPRPAESGAHSGAAAVLRGDPARLTAQERNEIRRRVRAGEKVAF